MNKDKELELKVQMFCAAIGEMYKDNLYRMERTAEDVNEAFEIMKGKNKQS